MLEMLVKQQHGAVLACLPDRPAILFKEYLQVKNANGIEHGDSDPSNNCHYTVAYGSISFVLDNIPRDVPFAAYWITTDDSSNGQALLSTEHGNPFMGYEVVEESQRVGSNDHGELVRIRRVIPAVRKEYLTLSRFIDQSNDLLTGQHGRTHGTTRWKTATIFWLLKLIVFNARIIWNSLQTDRKKELSMKEFMESLAFDLHPLEEPTYDHVLEHQNDAKKNTRCVLKHAKGTWKCNKRTTSKCKACNVWICKSCAGDVCPKIGFEAFKLF